ncbi:neural cell adhesion molecule 1-like [Ornithodoros turicata]|uniref:neural cell adhesion molecule 1-like n=1 Tax=Ornithodoros turicata TaxID=34597 RepID=UPI0031387D31
MASRRSCLLVACVLIPLRAALRFGYLDDNVVEVTGIVGREVSLPCDLRPAVGEPTDDVPLLVLWFREGFPTPLLSADARRGGGGISRARVWKDDAWDVRLTSNPPALLLGNVKSEHAGTYVCRVDFRQAQTTNRIVRLLVVVPPSIPVITDRMGQVYNGTATFNRGDIVHLQCESRGGQPRPTLSWLRDDELMQPSPVASTSSADGVVSRIHVGPLTRADLLTKITCQAQNNNVSEPLATTVVLDLNLAPTGVSITGGIEPLHAGRPALLSCVSTGSRPTVVLSWWKDSGRLPASSSNNSASSVTLIPTSADHGRRLACRAHNPHLAHDVLEDAVTLRVHYPPELHVRLGNHLREGGIMEHRDVYLECSVSANPPVTEVGWRFEGQDLHTNTSAGLIVSNRSLVLQKVQREARGHYSCTAANSLGRGTSGPFFLRVQYAPVCVEGQQQVYGAARHEAVQVSCEVSADPATVAFEWRLNSSAAEVPPHSSAGVRSFATVVARSEADYGALACWARNSVGIQKQPCVFVLVPAGPPESPSDCVVSNQTEDSFFILCREGHHGGLRQHFVLELQDSGGGRSRANLSGSLPAFQVVDLPAGTDFVLVVYAANAKGRSPPVLLTAGTLPAAAESILRQGTETGWQSNFSPVLAVLLTVVLGFALLAFVVVVSVRLWTQKGFHSNSQSKRHASERTCGPAPDVVDRTITKEDATELETFPEGKGLCLATLDPEQCVVSSLMPR